jgi:nitrite reductase/ring-hydroxylating ferredoxin subunit
VGTDDTRDNSRFVRAMRSDDLEPGRVTIAAVEGRRIAIAAVRDEVFACEDSCPHAGSSFAEGKIIGDWLICPAHGAKFDPLSGACVNAPYSPLMKHPVRIVDGFVEVCLTTG